MLLLQNRTMLTIKKKFHLTTGLVLIIFNFIEFILFRLTSVFQQFSLNLNKIQELLSVLSDLQNFLSSNFTQLKHNEIVSFLKNKIYLVYCK